MKKNVVKKGLQQTRAANNRMTIRAFSLPLLAVLSSCATTWQGGTSSHELRTPGGVVAVDFSSSVSDAHIKEKSEKQVRVIIRKGSDHVKVIDDKFIVEIGPFLGEHQVSPEGIAIYELIDPTTKVVILRRKYDIK